jgi:hypothetical protein
VFHAYGGQVRVTTADKKEEIEALLLAGLAGSPACWTIIGRGWERDSCPAFSIGSGSKSNACTTGALAIEQHNAAARGPDLERLTTILRWYRNTQEPTDRVVAQWDTLKGAWETHLAAFEAIKNAGGGAPFVPPAFDVKAVNDARTFAEVAKAFDAYVKDTARAAQQTQQVKLLQASVALAKASLDFGVALTDGLGKLTAKDLFPGLPKLVDDASKIQPAFVETSRRLSTYSGYLATTELALTQDWGGAVARIVAIVRSEVAEKCKHEAPCDRLMERLSRYSGLFTALVSEKDPEKVAEALDAAAMPIGGWRHKQLPGAFTLSLTAFPGIGGGVERRWGQYGVVREHGDNSYLAAPTLQMPLGLDFAWGWDSESSVSSSGFFISVLDPAAYLQYDPDHGGRLPGAQILTSLAPGLAIRQSLGPTPFVLTLYGVFRPNFRAWEPGPTSPAAHALQFGASLAVDVTLFELYAKRK